MRATHTGNALIGFDLAQKYKTHLQSLSRFCQLEIKVTKVFVAPWKLLMNKIEHLLLAHNFTLV